MHARFAACRLKTWRLQCWGLSVAVFGPPWNKLLTVLHKHVACRSIEQSRPRQTLTTAYYERHCDLTKLSLRSSIAFTTIKPLVWCHTWRLCRATDAQLCRRSDTDEVITLQSIRETSCATRRHATSHVRIWRKSQRLSPGVTSHLRHYTITSNFLLSLIAIQTISWADMVDTLFSRVQQSRLLVAW